MTENDKRYAWNVIKGMRDGDEFMRDRCTIDWDLFIECVKLCMDKRVLWPLDLIISEDGSRIKMVGYRWGEALAYLKK